VDNLAYGVQKNNPGDGFETLVFDQGKGNDADLAWVKINAASANTVWFAFKSSLLEDKSFAIRRSFASKEKIDPAKLDYFQSMTAADAGNPIPKTTDYPMKGLSEMDSTCRVAINFYPNANIPGLCPMQPTPGPVVSGGNPSNPTTPKKPGGVTIRNNNK
jgi:hypothetical protein